MWNLQMYEYILDECPLQNMVSAISVWMNASLTIMECRTQNIVMEPALELWVVVFCFVSVPDRTVSVSFVHVVVIVFFSVL